MSNIDLLSALQERIERELICPLKDSATNIVFGKGNPNAQVVFIGEAPGKEEDVQGMPFVGRAGRELDKLLATIHLSLQDVYIANILKYRPPNNRDPTTTEIMSHTPYLIEQLRIIKPRVIVTLGNYSTKFVLAGMSVDGMKHIDGITKIHGQLTTITLQGEAITIMPSYHPAAMLYNPLLREALEKDFLTLGELLSHKPTRRTTLLDF